VLKNTDLVGIYLEQLAPALEALLEVPHTKIGWHDSNGNRVFRDADGNLYALLVATVHRVECVRVALPTPSTDAPQKLMDEITKKVTDAIEEMRARLTPAPNSVIAQTGETLLSSSPPSVSPPSE
jgi:hypothetical protein